MKLAISNIAWDICEDKEIAGLLLRYSIDAIDIAPGKYFPDPMRAQEVEITRIKRWWEEKGIEITGMQGLLFGTTGLNLFGPPEVQATMLDHLNAVCRIAAGLGATRLVFGSPKNRDRSGLNDEDANEIAINFFRRLGDIARAHGVVVCLEPNPSCYGCNFMTHSSETAKIVEQVAHASIRMQLDTGAIQINGEDVAAIVSANAGIIQHIHASEPNLVPLGDGGTDHCKAALALVQTLSHHVVSIEMLATKNESHLHSIERALQVAIRHYRSGTGVKNKDTTR
jgi:sugar phosphate isomerase/epimerase